MSDTYRRLTVRSRREWRAWLDRHHADTEGVWLVRYKVGAGPQVPHGDVVEEAIAFGWVDSRPRVVDDKRSALLVTPRKKGSSWSKANKERVAKLEAAGLMSPAGRAVVERAKADGTWSALDQVEQLAEPDDLTAALESVRDARRYWDAFPPSTRRAILEWIGSAKKPQTRAARVRETAEQAGRDIRANQWRQPRKRGG